MNLVVYKIRILYALTYTLLHYLFSDFLESIKHQASFSDKTMNVNMASCQYMISLPCYEGFLKFEIWFEEPQSVSQ